MKNDNDIFYDLDSVRAFERNTSTEPISQECQRQFYHEVTTEDYKTVNCVPQVDEHDREFHVSGSCAAPCIVPDKGNRFNFFKCVIKIIASSTSSFKAII